MPDLELISSSTVKSKFDNYPDHIKPIMLDLRKLILQTASETEGITQLEESLKWNEPSYRSNIGSTLRIDWKEKDPEHYALYFQCTSSLVPTFKLVFQDTFEFEGNRAIRLNINSAIQEYPLKECIKTALCYHKVKHQINLGL